MTDRSPHDSPAMSHYRAIKREYPDALLFYRMGDFYECFYEDARTIAKAVGITLTQRQKSIPMAGVPYRTLDGYLKRLIDLGFKVAICDQVEDAKLAQGLVKREVTRVVTPGTLTESTVLDDERTNYLVAVNPAPPRFGVAWIELSTGEFLAADCDPGAALDLIDRLDPAELLVPDEYRAGISGASWEDRLRRRAITVRPSWHFDRDHAHRALCRQFGTRDLSGFDCEDLGEALGAAGAIRDYLEETQRTTVRHVFRLRAQRVQERMRLDRATRRCLELAANAVDGSREGTLFSVLALTLTPMGARRLREDILAPLLQRDAIEARLDAVAALVDDGARRAALRTALESVLDLERIAARIGAGRAGPRDMAGLRQSLGQVGPITGLLADRPTPLLARLHDELDALPDLADLLARALVDSPPTTIGEGGVIREGFDAALDEYRALMSQGKGWILEFQAREIERTGIGSLKVGFNRVFGYYVELTRQQAEKAPPDYQRKQTLKNAERYITQELKRYEEKVLSAETRARELEIDLFLSLRAQAVETMPRLLGTAQALGVLDVLAALAEKAVLAKYVRPALVETPMLDLRESRHPVVEATHTDEPFVPNDCRLGFPQGDEAAAAHLLVITGPNMAGKSTYIRQVALCQVMAQIGGFVPAAQATMGLADRIFARVGASDELVRGNSTFMVEMTETANILNNATAHSLIIFDEVGRGTSTFDGVSLAWAICEHVLAQVGARTLFATHYHELTELESLFDGVANANVAVKEWGDQVIFLRRIMPGGTDKSYGIAVARMAGLPSTIIDRAREILANLERQAVDEQGRPKIAGPAAAARPLRRHGLRVPAPPEQRSLFETPEEGAIREILQLRLESLTGDEALAKLSHLHRRLVAAPPRLTGR